MEVIIRPTKHEAARLVSGLIERVLRSKDRPVLGLATGRTMEELYQMLVEDCRSGDVSYGHVHTFNLDEYIGLSPSDPNSYRTYMNEKFFKHIDIDIKNTYLPNGMAEDIDVECERYESLIVELGGIDLQLLGIGQSGHIGFNEPLSALRSRTRAKALTPQTIEQNAELFGGDSEKVPKRAITMGVGTILDSRRCVLLATGNDKAEIIAKAVEGPVTSMISATALQLHPKCTVVIDECAAHKLQNREYYRWIFDNEPEWESFRD